MTSFSFCSNLILRELICRTGRWLVIHYVAIRGSLDTSVVRGRGDAEGAAIEVAPVDSGVLTDRSTPVMDRNGRAKGVAI